MLLNSKTIQYIHISVVKSYKPLHAVTGTRQMLELAQLHAVSHKTDCPYSIVVTGKKLDRTVKVHGLSSKPCDFVTEGVARGHCLLNWILTAANVWCINLCSSKAQHMFDSYQTLRGSFKKRSNRLDCATTVLVIWVSQCLRVLRRAASLLSHGKFLNVPVKSTSSKYSTALIYEQRHHRFS